MAPKRQVTPAMTAFVRRGDRLALDVRCVTFMGGAAHGNTGDRDCHQKPSLYLASHDATTFCLVSGPPVLMDARCRELRVRYGRIECTKDNS